MTAVERPVDTRYRCHMQGDEFAQLDATAQAALDRLDDRRCFMKVLSAWIAHDVDETVRLGGQPLRTGDLEPANARVYARGKRLLVAAHGREDLLLQVAAQLEHSMPWQAQQPALRA